MIESGERLGFEDLSNEYEPKYRNSRRVLISSSSLAKRLYSRLEYVKGEERRGRRGGEEVRREWSRKEEREYEPKYRNSRRVLISSSTLAKRLYSRLEYVKGGEERKEGRRGGEEVRREWRRGRRGSMSPSTATAAKS